MGLGGRRFLLWVREYLSDVLAGFATLTLAIAGIGASFVWGRGLVFGLVGLGVVFAAAGVLYEHRKHKPSLMELTQTNEELKAQVAALGSRVEDGAVNLVTVVNVLLRDLAECAGIYKPDARLSVYRHDDGQFVLVGRVSINPRYALVGREAYPDTQGFIAEVWKGLDKKPKISLPEDRAEWIDAQVCTYGLSRQEAAALRMHTRAMCGARFQRDHHAQAYGVLCIESDKARATVTGTTRDLVADTVQFRLLTDVLELAVSGIEGEEARKGLLNSGQARRPRSPESGAK